MVMEDDVCFAKDAGFIEAAVGALPDDYDFAKLEWYPVAPVSRDEVAARDRAGGFWASAHGIVAHGTAAVAFSARGMDWKLGLMEKAAKASPFDGTPLRSIDRYDEPGYLPTDLRAYVAVPCVAVQRPHGVGDPHMHAGAKNYNKFLLRNDLSVYTRGV